MTVVNVTDAVLKGKVVGPTFTGDVDGAKFTGSITYMDAPPAEKTVSLFTTQTPATSNNTDGPTKDYELGVKFKSSSAGNITALRFWKGSEETGTHVGNIWSDAGTKLASVTFVGETASGWQVQKLATPVAITANTVYIAAVGTSNTKFCVTGGGLAAAISNAPLSTIVGSNGVYGPRGEFPTRTTASNNYFRDIIFVAGPPPAADTQAPSTPTNLTGKPL